MSLRARSSLLSWGLAARNSSTLWRMPGSRERIAAASARTTSRSCGGSFSRSIQNRRLDRDRRLQPFREDAGKAGREPGQVVREQDQSHHREQGAGGEVDGTPVRVERAEKRGEAVESERHDQEGDAKTEAVEEDQPQAARGRSLERARSQHSAQGGSDAGRPAGGETDSKEEAAGGTAAARSAVEEAPFAHQQRDSEQAGDLEGHHQYDDAGKRDDDRPQWRQQRLEGVE